MKRILLISISVINQILMSTLSVAQPFPEGSIVGLVRDSETELALPFSNLILEKDDKIITGTASDFLGTFVFEKLEKGSYDLSISFLGYEIEVIRGIPISEVKPYKIEAYLCKQLNLLKEVVIEAKLVPIIEKDCCTRCTFYCGGSRQCCVHRKECADAEEEELTPPEATSSPTLLVYPNPASSMITVELSEEFDEKTTFRILDRTGRIVLQLSPQSTERFKIPVDRLPNGVYLLSAELKDTIVAERFIVTK